MQNHVIGFEPYNERLCKLRIKGKYNNIMLINEYAQAEDHTEKLKNSFMTIYSTCWTKHQEVTQK
jgi:hypothetical protein